MIFNTAFLISGRKGFAGLITLLFVVSISLIVVSSFAFVAMREIRITRAAADSVKSYYAAESGIEDAVYRFVAGKQIASGEVVATGTGTTTITIATAGARKTITAAGVSRDAYRTLQAVINENTTGISFHYGIQVGDGGLSLGGNAEVIGNVYSNGNIIGSNGASISGDVIVAGGIAASPSAAWETENANQPFATAASNRDIAQSFTATAAGKLNRVSVYLGKIGNPNTNLALRITADNNNKPDTDDMASASISYASVGLTPSWIDVAFASPPTLNNGNQYWIVLDYGSNSAANYWNWRKDAADGYADNTGKYASDWDSGNPAWTNVGGDLAFRVWIGGTNTKIDNVTIGNAASGSGRANLFTNTTIHGSACPNQYCIVDNPSRAELPVSAGVIQDWRNEAAAGGTCAPPDCDIAGNLHVANGASKNLGPKKITGSLTVDNNGTLIVTGTIWVQGDIILNNGCAVRLGSGYSSASGVIISDGAIAVNQNCNLQGSGTAGSYLMLLSAKNAPASEVIEVDNNAAGVIYYASNGKIDLENNASAREVTGYGIELGNNAVVTYDSGLANVLFSQGPSGGYDIEYWQEIE